MVGNGGIGVTQKPKLKLCMADSKWKSEKALTFPDDLQNRRISRRKNMAGTFCLPGQSCDRPGLLNSIAHIKNSESVRHKGGVKLGRVYNMMADS